ncbi:Leucine-zipper-like transcriptional regulator 1 [Tritrichomonas musculus]|uniref:Leucine-zipper-like transcriptional regulator 1 n=1 Tax=Tritrichomonas musculus TaxID=1915356 RepID=A0ABR2HXG1_9EUKA
MSEFIVICNQSLENIFKKIESKNITTSYLLDSLNLQNCVLFIVTPSYQLLLKPDQNIIEDYPDLIQNAPLRPHAKPKYYILIKDATKKYEEISIFIYLRFNYSTPLVAFPVSFNFNEIDDSDSLFNLFKRHLTFQYKSLEFYVNNNQKLTECSIIELVDLLRYNYLTCHIKLLENSSFLKQIVERTSLIKKFFEAEFQFITSISQLVFFWQPAMIKEQLIDKEDANYFFSSYNSTVTAHNMFLVEYQQKMVAENENIIDIFCDFNIFFEQSEYLFRNYSAFDCFFKNKCKYFDFGQKIENILKMSNDKTREPFFHLFFLPISRLNDFYDFLLKIKPLTPSYYIDNAYIEEALSVCKNYITKVKGFLVVKPTLLNEIVEIQDRIINRNQFDILSPSRSLLSAFKGKFDHGLSNQGYLYIFNDLIFLTKVDRKGEKGRFIEHCNKFLFLTEGKTIYICKNDHEFIKFTFLDSNNFNFAIQQISDQKTLYYSKANVLDKIFLWECVDSTFSFSLTACSCGAIVNNYMYVIGGYNGQKFANHVSVYDIKNNLFKTIYNPLPGRKFHSISEINGIIFIFGGIGSDSHTILGDFISLDTNSADTSMQKRNATNMPCPRYGHTLVSANESQLCLFGGIDRNKKFLGDLQICTCLSNNIYFMWKQVNLSHSPCPRAFHSAVTMNGRYMIIYGGILDRRVLDDVHIFDIGTKKWLTPVLKGDLIVPRHSHKAIMYENWMIVIGGQSADANEYLSPFGIRFEINEEEKIEGTIVNFTSGGNDRPNLSNFSIGLYDQKLIIIGGYDKTPDNNSKGIFRVPLPKAVLSTARIQVKGKPNKQLKLRKPNNIKKSQPKYLAKELCNELQEKQNKTPFLQSIDVNDNKETINNINDNDNNIVKTFDSLNSIELDLPLDFSKITPKQVPCSYSKPFILFDSLLPIISGTNKKGLSTYPKDEEKVISTMQNSPEKKRDDLILPQNQTNAVQNESWKLTLPPKLDSDDDSI